MKYLNQPIAKHLKKYYPVYSLICILSLVIILTYLYVRKYENKTILEKTKIETINRKKAIEECLKENIIILEIFHDYFQKNQKINRNEFKRIVDPTLKIKSNIQAIEWIPRVEKSERKKFENLARQEGFFNFEFKEFNEKGTICRAKERNYYYPIYYFEPFEINEKAFGFDLTTHTLTNKKLNTSIEKYGRAFTSGLKLIQDSLEFGFAVYLPVYSNELNKDKVVGFVAGVFKVSKTIDYALSPFPNNISIKLYDNSDSLKKALIYSNTPTSFSDTQEQKNYSTLNLKQVVSSYPIRIDNLTWTIEFVTNVKNESINLSLGVLIIGLIAVLAITLLFLFSYRYSINLKKLITLLRKEINQCVTFEKQLKQSEEMYYNLFSAAPLPISFIRLDNRTIVEVNAAFEKVFGYKKNDIIGITSMDFGLWVNPEDRNTFYKIFFENEDLINHEVLIRKKNGEYLTCLISGSLIRLRDQDYIFTFFQDITERKKAEETLRLSETKYHDIFNSVNDSIIVTDYETGELVDANTKTFDMFKYSLDELKKIDIGNLSNSIKPYHYENFKDYFTSKHETLDSKSIERQAKDKHGKVFWVELNFKKMLFNDRYRIISVCRDITERKKAESLLVENEFLFRTQFSNSNIGITISTPEKQYIRANKKFCEIVGYTEEELTEKFWSDITFPDDIEIQTPLFNKILAGEQDAFDLDKRYIHKNGNTVYTHISASCLRNPDGSIHYIISNVLDISDRTEMENKILKAIIETEESERMRFAQELHDGLGPILSSIKMYTQWMAKPDANLDHAEALKHMENLIGLAHQSTREVAFGLSPHILKDFGITEALNSFVNKIKGDETPSIIINSNILDRFDETVETIVYRILIECINNSLKHSQANLIKINLSKSESILNIDYSDNGVGFLLNEVIDKKMGMGIYNIKSRLKSINGNITINTQPDKGTIIKMTIKL